MYLIVCVCVAFFFSWLGDTLCVLRQLIVGVAIKLSFFRKRLFVNRSWLKLDFFFSLFFGLDVANVSIVVLVVSSFYHSLLNLFFLADKFCSTSTSCCHLSTAYEAFRPCKCSHAKKCRTVSATHIGLSVISCLYIFCGLQFSVNWYISEDALKVLLACFRGLPILPIILYNL